MKEFAISYCLTCNGTVTVKAESVEHAKKLVKEMKSSELGGQADDSEIEITFVEGLAEHIAG